MLNKPFLCRFAAVSIKDNLKVPVPVLFSWQEVVILCHGLGDHKDGFHLPALAEALSKKGLGSLRLDFPGNGQSPGTFCYGNMEDEV